MLFEAGKVGTVAQVLCADIAPSPGEMIQQLTPSLELQRVVGVRVRAVVPSRRRGQFLNVRQLVVISVSEGDAACDVGLDARQPHQAQARLQGGEATQVLGRYLLPLHRSMVETHVLVERFDVELESQAKNWEGDQLEERRVGGDIRGQAVRDLLELYACFLGSQVRRARVEPAREVLTRGDDHSANEARQALVHPETEDTGVAECADTSALDASSERLCRIFDEGDSVGTARGCESLQLQSQPVQMRHKHGTGIGVDQVSGGRQIDVARAALDVGEDRTPARTDHHVDHFGDRVRGQDHILSWLDQLLERQVDSDAGLRHAHGVSGAGEGRDGALERGNVWLALLCAMQDGVSGNPPVGFWCCVDAKAWKGCGQGHGAVDRVIGPG